MAVKFFDEAWYLARNPDVAAVVESGELTAEQHFEQNGMAEGRSPSPLFDANYYLAQNSDVAAAVEAGETTAYEHFAAHGHTEGRAASPYFNVDYYLTQNPDVADAVEAGQISAYEHYQASGIAEGRAPLASFNVAQYLTANPDVAAAVEAGDISAVQHFLSHGINEDRSFSAVISVAAYLAVNEDIANAVEAGQTTGLAHLLTYGVAEGRELGNGISPAQFANDPVYQQAIEEGDTDAALARVSEVAPFLPEFEAPEGFELPADWPIPQDFVPVEGTLLTVPEGWQPAEPTQLPPYFEQPFNAELLPGGAVSFPDATGEIVLVNQGGQGVFAQGNFLADITVSLNGTSTVSLAAEQTLVGNYADIAQVNIVGDGAVRALGTDEADVIDASGWNAVNVTVEAGAGDDTITIADTQTALGGEGADTFVIDATTGVSSVITVDDYNFEQGDVVDLSQVEGFNLFAIEVRGAEHDGTTWQWGDSYTGNSIGIWLAPEVANVQLTDARSDTMKFILPEMEGLEGYTSMQMNINDGAVLRANDEALEILRGGDGDQVFLSGAQADILSGGAGADTFVVRDGSKSNLANTDYIFDFEIGTDVLVSHSLISAGEFVDAGALAALDAESISAALTAEAFAANAGAYFTVGEGEQARTYIALNDGTAGYDAAADTLIDITGYSGDIAQLSVIGVPEVGDLLGQEVQQVIGA